MHYQYISSAPPGNIEEAVGHLLNFVKFSGNPRATLLTLQQTLPPPIFNILIRAVAATSQVCMHMLHQTLCE